jgi:hypothetical protein
VEKNTALRMVECAGEGVEEVVWVWMCGMSSQ